MCVCVCVCVCVTSFTICYARKVRGMTCSTAPKPVTNLSEPEGDLDLARWHLASTDSTCLIFRTKNQHPYHSVYEGSSHSD